MSYLLHNVLLAPAYLHKNKIAIREENSRSISYQDLQDLSNQFANVIKAYKSSILKNPYVGILSAVNIDSIAAILGVLKAGCCYVPLDDASPVDRLLHILDNTSLDILIIEKHYVKKHDLLLENNNLKKIIVLSHDLSDFNCKLAEKALSKHNIFAASKKNPAKLNQASDDLAYILHSSGSTGVPKGIMLSHRNARTFVDWMHKEFKISAQDIIMSRAPFKFDLSVFDIFNTLKAGATLICFDWNKDRNSQQKHKGYVSLLEKSSATILYTTPSTFITLLNRGGLGQKPNCLKTLMYAGEPFPIGSLRTLKTRLPAARIANIYGPTETNIITYHWINDIATMTKSIPLGKEVDDTEILIVNEAGDRICGTNELGEIWCRGGTVTLGYLGEEAKTKKCLVTSPFHAYPCKFWRTGDFGYRDQHGLLHYRGRRDHMVKVKGYRIELGEIESALAHICGLDEFAVVAIPDMKFSNRIYCYYSILPNNQVGQKDIIYILKNKIPDYMLPYKYIKLPSLPKTSSGKIDRVTLAQQLA